MKRQITIDVAGHPVTVEFTVALATIPTGPAAGWVHGEMHPTAVVVDTPGGRARVALPDAGRRRSSPS